MMNRNRFIKSFIITAALVIAVGINSYAETGTIKGSAIRLRKEANTESTVIDTYGDGEKVEVIKKDGEWYKVTIDKKTGYIYQDYISVDEDTTNNENKEEDKNTEKEEETKSEEKEQEQEKNTKKEETKDEDKETDTVKLGTVKSATTQKIYILPNIGSSVIGEVKQDSDVDIIQEVNGWAYVSTDELSGWARYEKIANEEEKDKISTYEEQEENNEEDKQDEDVEEEKKDSTENEKTTEENKTTEQNTENKEENKNNTDNEKKAETNGDVSVAEKTAYISDSSVNFRKEPNTSSDVIKTLSVNTKVTISAENGNWYKVTIGDDTGYVSKDYISNSKVETTSRSSNKERTVEKTTGGEVTGDDIVAYAKKYLGYKYVYGEESPSKGFDCSGLVWYVYKHFGYNVSRSSSALANDGKTISKKSDLQPGDILIFLAYNDYSRVGHVGIYIGNNEFIHANDEKTGVIITSLDYGKYPERFVSGRRIID